MNITILHKLLETKGAKADVIRKTGLSRPTIDGILSGGDPRVSTIEKIADALKIPVTTFFTDGDCYDIRTAGRDYHESRDSVVGNKTVNNYHDSQSAEIESLKNTIEQLKARIEDKDMIIALLKRGQE